MTKLYIIKKNKKQKKTSFNPLIPGKFGPEKGICS